MLYSTVGVAASTSVPSVLKPSTKGILEVQTLLAVVPADSPNRLPQNLSVVLESGPGQEPPCSVSCYNCYYHVSLLRVVLTCWMMT